MSLPARTIIPATIDASGLQSCHVILLKDRDPSHSGAYAQFGHSGSQLYSDPDHFQNESGIITSNTFTRFHPVEARH